MFRDDRFLITVGNYRKPILSLWSTKSYLNRLDWQDDESPSSYINCLAWNPKRTHEFCLGSSQGTLHFCTIEEESERVDMRLQVLHGQISPFYSGNAQSTGDVTACVYLPSMMNLVLCATSGGLLTCWNSRLSLCLRHWKIDSNEICFIRANQHKLLTGSSTGCLKLWNIENLQTNLGQLHSTET